MAQVTGATNCDHDVCHVRVSPQSVDTAALCARETVHTVCTERQATNALEKARAQRDGAIGSHELHHMRVPHVTHTNPRRSSARPTGLSERDTSERASITLAEGLLDSTGE